MHNEIAPIIITAMMGAEDQSFFTQLRKAYYPLERNYLDAHITLFHHLPPGYWMEIKRHIVELTKEYEAPYAHVERILHLDKGVAFYIDSPEMLAIRSMIAERLIGLLIPQDQVQPRLHVTIQNKVSARESKQLFETLNDDFEPFPIDLIGIEAFYYRGGPWEKIGHWRFRP